MNYEPKLDGIPTHSMHEFEGPEGRFHLTYVRGYRNPSEATYFYGDQNIEIIFDIDAQSSQSRPPDYIVSGPSKGLIISEKKSSFKKYLPSVVSNLDWLLKTRYMRAPYVERPSNNLNVVVEYRGDMAQ